MKERISLLFLLLPFGLFAQSLKVLNLQCEYKTNPLGIESLKPKLSWQMQSDARNTMQIAYRVLVAGDAAKLKSNIADIWDSGKVPSGASLQVSCNGKPMQAAKTYYWKVMVWDNHGKASAWSNTASWQMGLLTKADWHGADWIAYDKLPDSSAIVPFYHGKGPKKLGAANDVLPLIRKAFNVEQKLKKATLFLCGLGHFELSLNGKKVGDHFLDPGWTKYNKQALYVPFDVTSQLLSGKNTIGVMLGNGFYYIPRDKRYRKLTGAFGYPKMICRLMLEYDNGKVENVVSDGSWKTAPSPVTFSSIYGGEDYNANLEQPGWNTNNFDDLKWRNVVKVDGIPELSVQMAEPLKIMQVLKPQNKKQLANGAWIYDLGQNFSGIPQISVQGKKGDTVRIIPAELVNEDGSANQKASGSPHYYDYVLKGNVVETWHPLFTYYGFRYLQVQGAVNQGETNPHLLPVIVEIKGLHTRNSAETVGNFACSNELFNKTFKLIDWAMKSNMASVFTDCPHREKLGWLEEAHLVGSSLHYNYDIVGLARKCINDMRISQTEDGLIPEISPEYVKFDEPFRDSPEWGSNAVILPWYVYQWYGDKEVLAQNYDMIKRYLAYLDKKSQNHLLYQGLGDWYDLGPNPPGVSQLTPQGITATSLYYYDLDIAGKIATLLGKSDDAASYKRLAAEVKQAYNQKFFNADTKQYGTGSQTANAMSVYAGLVEPQYKAAVVNNIVKDIRGRGNALTAGDIGYRYLLRVLDDEGLSDVIYDMNSRADVPGYGYQLAHGATALTESWAALPSVSNNHFMLGHLMEWLYSGLAGIRPADNAIAFNKIEIRPETVGNVTWAKANYQSPYGNISSNWAKDKNQFKLEVKIPANTIASIFLPVKNNAVIMVDGQNIKTHRDLKFIGYHDGKAEIKAGSGNYTFIAK
ncbi:Bacterial alpha-L-rhamnosidase [Mucilaginibacter rubeus]|uniref:alpha-L-rhamnosidase n=1 Tax=Mucilaginibacter rubeus TaxID=2027860 RepID=A0AAE6JH14_9SPHI|nr:MULTISPECIES: alpha-L-rhamnosidase [Mucilaginibacter]QEM05288.1 Bacterial alpha-L-rhamnosidase [Mucilaginibacter rubeus]QEM17879.1 Bacterial alpha-L-rhamnosidase [Mucilaginibacter gossypii]QTE45589.1 family 78 glycoside hydrolase catalytic domain [Mucilaginibacter rubeus]QTE52186.1 family 78 glycoside hydrolase catalytic domain [Mucilaginibacter rubeus]QTE57274.1 family 78 glycoside hydrolase catalytic domain [Mucilaginibacter rubeus]